MALVNRPKTRTSTIENMELDLAKDLSIVFEEMEHRSIAVLNRASREGATVQELLARLDNL